MKLYGSALAGSRMSILALPRCARRHRHSSAPIKRASAGCTRSWSKPTPASPPAAAPLLADKVEARMKRGGLCATAADHTLRGARSSQGGRPGRRAARFVLHDEGVAAARPYRRRRRQARGLDPRSLQDGRGKRLFLSVAAPADMKAMDAIWIDTMIRFKQSGYRAEAYRQAGADLRRGDELSVQRRAMAGQEQTRPDRRRSSR